MKCFSREGFHGASIADIAAEAGMSAGHIYTYFENKEAIIAAICDSALAEMAQQTEEMRVRSLDLMEELVAVVHLRIKQADDRRFAALILEILAEAARNPRVAEIVREGEATSRAWLRDTLAKAGPSIDAAWLEARVEILSTLIDGWVMTAVKNPTIDRTTYVEALKPMFRLLLFGDRGTGWAQPHE